VTAIQLTRVEDAAIAVPTVWPVTLMVTAHSHPGHAPCKRLDLVCKHLPLTAVAPERNQPRVCTGQLCMQPHSRILIVFGQQLAFPTQQNQDCT
jgi:hypothetical protein